MLQPFIGNCPGNVSHDAKYKVKYLDGRWQVATLYRTQYGEYLCPAQPGHEALKKMVNQAKREVNGQPGGSFYINEYHEVLVPSSQGRYYRAGYYTTPIVFDYRGKALIGDGSRVSEDESLFETERLAVGDEWMGPRHGIPYVFTQRFGRNDIYYQARVGRNMIEVYLSDFCSQAHIDKLCRRLKQFKPSGRFYINEHHCLFLPLGSGECIYAGKLKHLQCWFPKDSCIRAARDYGLNA